MPEELIKSIVVLYQIDNTNHCYYVGVPTELDALECIREHTNNLGRCSIIETTDNVKLPIGDVRKITRSMTNDPYIRAYLLLNDVIYGKQSDKT